MSAFVYLFEYLEPEYNHLSKRAVPHIHRSVDRSSMTEES